MKIYHFPFCDEIDIPSTVGAKVERMKRSDYRKLVQASMPERFPSDSCICRGEGPRAVISGTSQYFDEYEKQNVKGK